MKKIVCIASVCLLAFASCSRDIDLYEGPAPVAEKSAEDKANDNAFKVFGIHFDPNQDWCSTVSGEVTIHCDASVLKVQLLAEVKEIVDEKVTEETTANGISVLNEKDTNGATTLKLAYDAPKDYLALYVGFQTASSYYVQKVEGNAVSFDCSANSRRFTRAADYTLPNREFKLAAVTNSYLSKVQPNDGKLYALSDDDYRALRMVSQDYTKTFKAVFDAMVFSVFPNGRYDDDGNRINNLVKVNEIGFTNENSYGYATKGTPVVVTPVYKRDGSPDYGSEVHYSQLYYYYYSDAEYAAASDKVAFLKSLPKFQAIPFGHCYNDSEDGIIEKRGSFALLYYGSCTSSETTIGVGTTGSFDFPTGTKIGFMVRANTELSPKKKGECYLDGRLNDVINTDKSQNFWNSRLQSNDPRAAWLNLNDHLLLCWESGTDADFNDIILEVNGLGGITPPPPVYPQVYTFCFEDTKEKGDYDMNDVVIRAIRKNETTVQYSIIACGAHDELTVCNINSAPIFDDKEIHSLFGKQPSEFINTQNGAEYIKPVIATVTVDPSFSFLDKETQPYIHDITTGIDVHVAEKGQNPYGILIPNAFLYPIEKTCIKNAYSQFNKWGENAITSTLWYLNSAAASSRVYNN